jgi:hypothetical protein
MAEGNVHLAWKHEPNNQGRKSQEEAKSIDARRDYIIPPNQQDTQGQSDKRYQSDS